MEHSTIFSDYVALRVWMLISCHLFPLSLSLNGHVFKSQHVSGEEESYVELKKIHWKLAKQTI